MGKCNDKKEKKAVGENLEKNWKLVSLFPAGKNFDLTNGIAVEILVSLLLMISSEATIVWGKTISL